jgi:hypothetical protein
MRPKEVLKAYRSFWSGYQKLCHSAGAVSKPSNGTSIQIDEQMSDADKVVITANIYMQDWRTRGCGPSDRVHILIHSVETYALTVDQISKSSVQVMYSRAVGNDANPLLVLHYDYEIPVQTAHPVFHAQFGMGDFSSPDFVSMGFRFTVTQPPKGTLYSSVRIPTPNMNLISVLLGLAADHLDTKFFDKFLKLVKESPITKWNAQCEALDASLQSGGRLPSHHWYTNL